MKKRRVVHSALRAAAVAVVSLIWLSAAPAQPFASPIHFSAPSQLPNATAGQPYQFSFCQPAAKAGARCGVPAGARNPSGGYGHYYVFSLHLSVPPPGLRLSNRSGLLTGTPAKAGLFTITVCVVDAERRPGVAPKPSCRATKLNVAAPAAPPPTAASFGGLWANGTFQTTSVAANSCGSSANGSVQFNLTQNGATVTGTMNYQVTGYSANPSAGPDCENLSPSGSIPLNGTVTGSSLAGSGFTLSETSPSSLTGTFTGDVQGLQLTVSITANR